MIKKILLGMFLVLLIVPAVLAVNENGRVIRGGKLLITDVDVKVDGSSDKNLDFGDRIKHEAVPESEIEFTVEVTNNFTRNEDLDIEDIQVEITIEGIDDDDDLDEDAKEFDLRADKNDDVKIRFTLPLEVDEGTYDVIIRVEGDDENGTTHEVEYELDLEVEKENNEVRFRSTSLNPSEISCQRSTQLNIGVVNTGASDEDDVVLEITNAELGVNFRELFDLSDDPFDSDSKFSKLYTVRIADDVLPGIYPILAQVTFDDGGETESTSLELVVNACEVKEAPKEEVKEEEPEVVVVSPPQVTVPTGGVTVTEPTAPAVTEEKSLLQSTGFVTALIVGEVLVVIVAVLLVVTLMRKRS